MFPQTTPILPSLPVKDSVLHQLHITDKKLPRGLACLKHTLLRSPSHTSSQESNTCTNSGLSSRPLDGYRWRSHSRLALQERLYDTIAESPIVHHGPKGDKDCYASQKKIFKSMSYLDQIAIVCLASGVHACQAPDCLQYREKLEELVPLCDSWLGLRDWVLCIVSCSLRTIRDRSKTHRIVNGRRYRIVEGDKIPPDEASQNGLAACDDGFETPEILARCRAHLATCILLTRTTAPSTRFGFDIVEWLGLETREGTSDKSGSIDGSRPGQNIYSVEWMESEHEPNPRPPPVRRPNIYMQTFDSSQEGSAAGPPVDVVEVFQLTVWFRNIARGGDVLGDSIEAPSVYDDDFIPVSSKAITEASEKISKLGFCQQRVWDLVRHRRDGLIELVPLVSALKDLPQLRHDKHKSCTSGDGTELVPLVSTLKHLPQLGKSCTAGDGHEGEDHKSCTPGEDHNSCTSGYCEYATLNFTSVIQLHRCLDHNCGTTTGEMFNQSLLVKALGDHKALEGHTITTAWKLDGMSLATQDKSYLAVSHVWSNGTGTGKWKVGQVNKCLWDFFVDKARRLECDGVWWDTVCIPQEIAARSIALNNMHRNYAAAKCTIVHDLYLAGIEWKNDGSPCIALVLSPWFTRGWTALELLLSERVFILFREGDNYTLKDLDEDVLAQHHFLDSHAHWIATDAVKRLRGYYRTVGGQRNNYYDGGDILSVLRARYTSWSRDQSIIAGLMCGLTDHVTLSEKDITKQILLKLNFINSNFLLHGLQTMSDPQFSWCPPRFVDIPSVGSGSDYLRVKNNGTLTGQWKIWYIPSKSYVNRRMIWPSSTDKCVQTQVQWALQEPEKCLILTCEEFVSQGLLVRPKAYKDRPEKGLYCKYIGALNFSPSHIWKPRFGVYSRIVIGYESKMVDVELKDCERIIKERNNHRWLKTGGY